MDNTEIINNMINKIYGGEHVSAQTDFEALISQKMNDALEQKKQEIAQSLYAEKEPTEEDSTEQVETDTENTDDAISA